MHIPNGPFWTLLSCLSAVCRDRLEALRGELFQREVQAKQQSADCLRSLAAEADRLQASCRQEGDARCAAVQVGARCVPPSLLASAARLPMLHFLGMVNA